VAASIDVEDVGAKVQISSTTPMVGGVRRVRKRTTPQLRCVEVMLAVKGNVEDAVKDEEGPWSCCVRW